MGKTTLYHPISLHVIRGAAEYCGFAFGKIKQLNSNAEEGRAVYTADVLKMPGDLMKTGTLLGIHHDLQECFMDDIRIDWVHMKQSGTWSCKITVYLKNAADSDVPLIPNPDPTIEPIHRENGAMKRSKPGAGGGGEVDVTWLIENDGTFCTHCGRVFDETDVSTYSNERGDTCCESCFYAELEQGSSNGPDDIFKSHRGE